jgi:hypothetical protein
MFSGELRKRLNLPPPTLILVGDFAEEIRRFAAP